MLCHANTRPMTIIAGRMTYWPAVSAGSSIAAWAMLNKAIIKARTTFTSFNALDFHNMQYTPQAGTRNDSTIIKTIMPWSTLPSVATTAMSQPQNIGSTSQIEWHENPQIVSSQSAVIFTLLVIIETIKKIMTQSLPKEATPTITKNWDFGWDAHTKLREERKR